MTKSYGIKGKHRFVTIDNMGLKLTKKEFLEGKQRYAKLSKSVDKKFKNMRKGKAWMDYQINTNVT